jgi:DNA-binding transcriptional MerR regulator
MTAQPAPQPQAEEQVSVSDVTAKTPAPMKKSASAFRTISEVATDLDVQQHVLRFWETKFSQIRPLKRGGGRRYYRPEDVDLLKTIHRLLYSEGYTIKGVQKLFREKGKNNVVERSSTVPAPVIKAPGNENFTEEQRATLQAIAGELRELRELLGKAS